MSQIDKDAEKEAIKEAISEWLDKQFALVGKWTLAGLMTAFLAGVVYVILIGQGWHK